MKTRWVWTQKSALQSNAGIDTLIADCERCHVTDILALDRSLAPYLIEQASQQGICVHVWWCVGYWPPSWVDAPGSWNTATLPDCNIDNLNFSLPEVQDAIEAGARYICQANPGIAGLHLDYIRYDCGMVTNSVSLSNDDITCAVGRIRAVTNEFGLQLTVAGVQDYYAGQYPEYNWCAEGVGQSSDEWIVRDLVDYILMMHYYGPAKMETILAAYEDKSIEIRARLVNGISPLAFMEQSQSLTTEQWRQLVEMSRLYNYDLAVFDNRLLNKEHKQILAGYSLEETEMNIVEMLRLKVTEMRTMADELDTAANTLAAIDISAEAAVVETQEALAAVQAVEEAL